MRLSVIVPFLFAALVAAVPAPGSDSAELFKRYCGNKPPTHPACPRGLDQVSGDIVYATP